MNDAQDTKRRREAGHSLAALLVTLAVLGGVWALVWFNVPRDLHRAPSAAGPQPDDLSSLIPPSLLTQPRVQGQSSPSGSTAPNLAPASKRSPMHDPALPGSGATGEPQFSDQGSRIETALDCREEVRKLCGDIDPGGGRFRDCVQQHRELMPLACQRKLEERLGPRAEGARAILAACHPDLRRWCPNIPMRGATVIRCLREHAPDLSGGCTDMLLSERVL